jgi:hypothetical protein
MSIRNENAPLDLRHRFDDGVVDGAGFRPRVQVQHHFGVAARLEDRALPHQLVAELGGVHEVAVVTDGNLPMRAVDDDRLRVEQLALARGRVPDVANRRRPRESRELVAVERVGDISHRA